MKFEEVEENKDLKKKEELNKLQLEDFNENNAEELSKIIKRFMKSYSNKDENLEDREWLSNELRKELPYLSDIEAKKLSDECFDEVNKFDDNLKSLNEAFENGDTKENWFYNKIKESSIGINVNKVGNYLDTVDNTIKNANEQMTRVITNLDGSTNQNMNLDGFIAEQYHVNTFNMNSKLNNSKYRAEVLAPKPGETYAKNSFDVVIRDSNNNIVHQYQMKYGKDYKATIKMIEAGNYNNQRIVVPAEQLEEVRKAFPTKTIEASIGGTDKVNSTSKSLTKAEAKEMQLKIQDDGIIRKEDWNHFKIKELSRNIAKNAGKVGLQAAVITTGFDMAQKAMNGEKIEANETIELALRTGTDATIKAGVTGAVKVGVEKGIIKVIPKGTPASIIANVVCVGIENIKIMGKVATGELTMIEALDQMGRITTSMIYGLAGAEIGGVIGAAALSWIPFVGPIVGGVVGGTVGYIAGSKYGETIYKVAKKVSTAAKKVVSRGVEAAKAIGRGIKNFLFG